MASFQQNTLYLVTPGSYISRDHLTLQVEVPAYPEGLPASERVRENAIDWRKLSIPIHHLESVCVFGQSALSPPALGLCWEHGVAVNYLSENGYLMARLSGVADTSVTLRRAQFRAADDAGKAVGIARRIIAGKIQNSRNSLLRAGRECEDEGERARLGAAGDALARQLRDLAPPGSTGAVAAGTVAGAAAATDKESDGDGDGGGIGGVGAGGGTAGRELDVVRGAEGLASQVYFSVFSLLLKQQREAFAFRARTRRPPRDRVNCLLSFLYALVRHDCVAALTAAGLDPFVGFLHADRPNRPSLALDLMEEFRPWLADRLGVTLINRQQLGPGHFREREGGAVEFTEAGRKLAIQAYQERKRESIAHPLLDQNLRIAQLPFVQARILARHLRGDLAHYVPFVPK
jgi:CRISPR-associated protein Cas1